MKTSITLIFLILGVMHLEATGTIIVLHGTGSAGKSSISKILQTKLPNTVAVSVDDFFWPELIQNGINRKLITKQMTHQEKIKTVIDNRGLLSSDLNFKKIFKKLYEHVEATAQNHSFVILDTVFINHSEYNNFCEITKNIPTVSVLVYCSPIHLAKHVMKRNNKGALKENRDIFSHMRNFIKLYKKSTDASTSIDTISQQEVDTAIQMIITYAHQAHIKRSRRKEKITQLQEHFEQKFFNKNNTKVSIEYILPFDIMVNTGNFSATECVELIYEKLMSQQS
jgi:chloramphenicol 3-O-phosphotransferase